MKKKLDSSRFRILYAILLVATIVFGSIYLVGPIIIRYIASVGIFIVCKREKVPFPDSPYVKIYSIFIAILFLTSLFKGYEVDFTKLFIGYYLTTYLWIWATYILVIKYNSLGTMIYTLFCICLFNSLVTIGQHFMNPIAFAIPQYLGVDVFGVDSMYEKSDNVITQFALFGIFGAFQNGYYSAVGAVLSLVLWLKNRKIYYLLFWIIAIFSLFCVQERAGFVAGMFFSSVLLYRSLLDSKSMILKCGVILVTIFTAAYFVSYGLEYSSYLEGTRYESFDMDTRTGLYQKSVDYISAHPFDANLMEFYDIYHKYPHNFLYNCFIYGTAIGGIMILFCIISIWFKSFKYALHPIGNNNYYIMLLIYTMFSYCVAGFTHNASIVSGDVLFWLLVTPIIFNKTIVNANFKKN